MSDVRTWIVTELQKILKAPGIIWSDTDGANFLQLTGISHAELLNKWFGEIDPVTKQRPGTGPDVKFTTCTSFLPNFSSLVRRAGGLPVKKLGPFTMHHEKAWVAKAPGASPQPGDYFLLGTPTALEHTGIILEIDDGKWSKVAGGAGGRNYNHDGVKRTALEPIPGNVFGWLDVDAYYTGWVKKP
jgi:hypothetical protein